MMMEARLGFVMVCPRFCLNRLIQLTRRASLHILMLHADAGLITTIEDMRRRLGALARRSPRMRLDLGIVRVLPCLGFSIGNMLIRLSTGVIVWRQIRSLARFLCIARVGRLFFRVIRIRLGGMTLRESLRLHRPAGAEGFRLSPGITTPCRYTGLRAVRLMQRTFRLCLRITRSVCGGLRLL